MAYDPTVWETYDVITKERLNKLEQGARTGTLLSGTDINTDKDWQGKKISNAAIQGAAYIGTTNYALVASDHGTVLHRDNSNASEGGSTWVTKKTVTVPSNQSGEVTVTYNISTPSSGVQWYYVQIIYDGTAVPGSLVSIYNSGSGVEPVVASIDIAAAAGKEIGLQLRTELGGGVGAAGNSLFEIRAVPLLIYPDTLTW